MKTRPFTRTMKNPTAQEHFLVIRSEREYNEAVDRLNALLDEIGDNPTHPRFRLIETQSLLIRAYDKKHHSLPEATPVEVIRFLMEEHGLTQSELPEIGAQSVVSDILSGRRFLNPRQMRALGERFGVDPGAFL
jgi:HTH-type transcriptional regulator / antitoxin HigA